MSLQLRPVALSEVYDGARDVALWEAEGGWILSTKGKIQWMTALQVLLLEFIFLDLFDKNDSLGDFERIL